MKREKQSEAVVRQFEAGVREQRRRRARQAGAEAHALLGGREVGDARGEKTFVQLAALVLKERERGKQLQRGFHMLPCVDELLEMIERKSGFFHRLTILGYV